MSLAARTPCDDAIPEIRDAEECTRTQRRAVLIVAVLASSMAFVDGTVVNVALPAIQTDLAASVIGLQWVVEGYALFLSALILLGGALGDRYGRKRVFGYGVAVFTGASLACGMAPTIELLIAARALQGLGAALMVPGSLALISASFPKSERGRAIGTWSAMTALSMAMGPVLGGWLVDTVSWRWVFFINLPVAAAILLFGWGRVPESRDDAGARRLDWAGAALATLGLGASVFGLIEAGRAGFAAPLAWIPLAIGPVCLAAFLWLQSRVGAPMVPLGLFRSRDFAGANFLTLLLYAALGGSTFFIPFALIQVFGYSATEAGAAMLPFIVVMVAMSRWAGGLVDRWGGRLPLSAGPVIAAAGFALFLLPSPGDGYWVGLFPAFLVLGVGMAISVAPLTTVVLGAVEDGRAGIASGINNAIARVAALIAIAIMGLALIHVFGAHLAEAASRLPLSSDAADALRAQRTQLAGATVPAGVTGGLADQVRTAIDAAFLAGFRVVMASAAGLALLSAVGAFLTITPKSTPGENNAG